MKLPSPTKAAALAALLLAAPAARAQDLPIPDYTIANQGRIGTLITQGVIDRAQGKAAHQSSGYVVGRPGPGAPVAPATRPAVAYRVAYVPSVAQRRQAGQGFADELRRRNPQAAQAIATGYAPGGPADYTRLYHNLLAGTGLPENDAATALAACLFVAWQVVGDNEDGLHLDGPTIGSLRAQLLPQVGAGLQANPAAAGESFKLQTVLLFAGGLGAVQKNKAPAFRQSIAALFQSRYGLDLTRLSLPAQGFGKK